MTLAERIIKDTITDRNAILKAHNLPANMPIGFIPSEMKPVGYAKYLKKDNMSKEWSCDAHFSLGETYPFYADVDNNGCFPIGKEGKGLKPVPTCWGKIKFIN